MLLLLISSCTCTLFLWPKPSQVRAGENAATLSSHFHFTTNGKSERLQKATTRYRQLIFKEKWVDVVPSSSTIKEAGSHTSLESIKIEIQNWDDQLTMETNESYELDIQLTNRIQAVIKAETIYGAIKALETFSQLTKYNPLTKKTEIHHLPLNIQDQPRFAHRGVLLDTSRNYYSVESILKTLDAMSFNKFNVFHWHLIDATSFPFQSDRYPELWKQGAYAEDMIYTKVDIAYIIEYAKDRGIRVIPELEAPAHAYTIGNIFKELGVCLNELKWSENAAEPPSGQLDPTNPKSIELVQNLIQEFDEVFEDKYIHLSGDEASTHCWSLSPKIMTYIQKNNLTLNDLLVQFFEKMASKAIQNGKSIMIWQEILLNHNAKLPNDTLVQVWLGPADTKKVIQKGHKVIASSSDFWYLDCGHGGWLGNAPELQSWCQFKSWQKVYSYNLLQDLSVEESKLVMGGEVAFWSEQIDEVVLDHYMWPRSSAAAEVLWSGNDKGYDLNEVLPRLNNWRFRMLRRGIQAEPLQPLWCVKNPGKCNLN